MVNAKIWWSVLLLSHHVVYGSRAAMDGCAACALHKGTQLTDDRAAGTRSPFVSNKKVSNVLALLLLLFGHYIMSDPLWPHGLQHARISCALLSPEVCSNSHPLSRWCYLAISSYAVPFSSCLLPFPTSWSFPTSQLLASGGQSIGTSASASVFPMNIQG